MRLRKPDYFDRFHCIGAACTDTCCAGWEIEVDEESCAAYRQMEGALGERIRRYLTVTDEESYFSLEDGRCPFLNREGLCDIIIEAGEGCICDICREHPRFYNWYGPDTEVGLGLCCEEAQRLMFEDSRPAGFITEEREDPDETAQEDPDEAAFLGLMAEARETAFAIIQDRSLALSVRLELCLQYADRLQAALDQDDWQEFGRLCQYYGEAAERLREAGQIIREEKPDRQTLLHSLQSLLERYRALEALDPSWPESLGELETELGRVLEYAGTFAEEYPQTQWEYEHLTVYFVNRYFMEAVYDMDVVSKVRFGVLALLIIRLMEIRNRLHTGGRTERDRDEIIRRYSREIEYCPENVAELAQMCWTMEELQTQSLCEMVKAVC